MYPGETGTGLLRFGPFELNTRTGEVRKFGVRIRLPDQSVKVLLALLERPGELSTREELRQRLWAVGTFVDFEHGLNLAVARLRQALGDTKDHPRYIQTLPRRGYRFIAELEPLKEEPAVKASANGNAPSTVVAVSLRSANSHLWLQLTCVLGGAIVGLLLTWIWSQQNAHERAFYSAAPLTSYVGHQICPSFAPDGERLAFAWDGEGQDNYDIYVNQIGVALPLRLTTGPEPDISPAWSPDGRTIAFLHVISETKAEVLLISAIAPGPARKISTVTVPPADYFHMRLTAWSPDGRWIAVSDGPPLEGSMSLALLSVETRECRRMTLPPVGYDDYSPAFSPDMKRLAFVRYSNLGGSAGDLYCLKLTGDLKPLGKPERLTSYNRQIASPVWERNGRTLLFVRHEVVGTPSLWRMQIDGNRRIEPLPIASDSSFSVAISPRANRIVYTRESENVNIWAVELNRDRQAKSIRRLIASTWTEDNPQFSPDGRQIAYQSSRSGRMEIWVCDRVGAHPRQLTHLGAVVSGFPRWSPDGKKIVFHSRPKSLASLYIIDADGGKPTQLTDEVENDLSPSWSEDGRWIYFASGRTGQNHVWRMSTRDGTAKAIGELAGWCPLASKDGRFLYYVTMSGHALRSVPLSGGPERELLSGLAEYGTSYAPASNGIYFIRSVNRKRELAFLELGSNRITMLAQLTAPVSRGMAISPEQDLLLYSQIDRQASELMMVDNFR